MRDARAVEIERRLSWSRRRDMTLALKKTQTEPVPTAGTCAVTSLSAQQDRPCMESRALYVKSVVLAIGLLLPTLAMVPLQAAEE